jgi:hypothetical protein
VPPPPGDRRTVSDEGSAHSIPSEQIGHHLGEAGPEEFAQVVKGLRENSSPSLCPQLSQAALGGLSTSSLVSGGSGPCAWVSQQRLHPRQKLAHRLAEGVVAVPGGHVPRARQVDVLGVPP